jgi:hypothetical protein
MAVVRTLANITYENKQLTPEEKREVLNNYYTVMINIARGALNKKPMPSGGEE